MLGETGRERVLDAGGNWTGEYTLVPAVQAIEAACLDEDSPIPLLAWLFGEATEHTSKKTDTAASTSSDEDEDRAFQAHIDELANK